MNAVTPELSDKLRKNNDQTHTLTKECESLGEDMKIKEKQLELISILKSLSLEEVEISKSTSGTIQERLVNFMRSWESLQKSN